ncbi:MAG: hypothetical protein M1840_007047 [Geoglossum simile]|nr:MAG: hypothetical protein M1840_007047 [Geoglossum simile]
MLLVFLILRKSQRRHYAPRTYLGSLRESQRTPSLPTGLFNWIKPFASLEDEYVLEHHSLDGYLFLRFMKICVVICLVGSLIAMPVLLPVNATGGNDLKQLDMLSFGNVAHKNRYYAHVFVGWVFFGFVLYMVTRECIYFINLRQVWLLSPLYANRISSRTVLITSIPDEYVSEARLRKVFGPTVKNVWINSDCEEVTDLVKERDTIAMKLEGAETKLVKLANAERLKAVKKGGATADEEAVTTGHTVEDANDESGAVAARLGVPQKKRPTHRLKFLVGKKVDTINWSRTELEALIPKVDELQSTHRAGKGKLLNSAFIEFDTQSAAQAAVQCVAHHQPLHMAPRYIGVTPGEVIWSNLRLKWWERIVKIAGATAFVVALIIFWSVPVAFVGTLSNINSLTEKVPFLSFIKKIPPVILGVVSGLLPAVLLSVLMALLPIILRLMARISGAPSLSQVELTVQNSYFAFQVVQVFLVATLASAASAAVPGILKNPSSAAPLLAKNLPLASNLYISYFIVQGLSISASSLLQIVGLILAKILGKLFDNTPRKMYKRWTSLSGVGWGTVFPIYTNLAVIAITYSCIAPLVIGFATVGLYLLYLAFKYNFLFVYDVNIDTRGLIYPRALKQILTGVYLGEVCLIGLFGIRAAPGPLILQVIFLIFTILFHISLVSALDPLLKYLPKTLEVEEESLLTLEAGQRDDGEPSVKTTGSEKKAAPADADVAVTSGATKGPNFFTKWLHPDRYSDFSALRATVPRAHAADIIYNPDTERDAYHNPAVSSPTPLLWIPRDQGGVSKQEVRHTSRSIPITDEGAHLDDANKIVWDEEAKPPIYEERVIY